LLSFTNTVGEKQIKISAKREKHDASFFSQKALPREICKSISVFHNFVVLMQIPCIHDVMCFVYFQLKILSIPTSRTPKILEEKASTVENADMFCLKSVGIDLKLRFVN